MDALAERWFQSGYKSEDLYKGKTDEIVKELRSWVVARGESNGATMDLLWDLFDTSDHISGFRNQFGTLDDLRIAPFKAKHVKNLERVKEYKELREKSTLRARFLLSTLSYRGLQWPALPCTPQWTEMDSEVCAFLKMRVPSYEAEKALEILEMGNEIAEWRLENARRESSADDQESIANKGPTAAVGFRDQEETQQNLVDYELPGPVNITGLIPPPRPRAEDSRKGLSPDSLSTIEEEPEETEETAETLARRIEDLNTTEEQTKVEMMPKTKRRNLQRRKAKARASEAAKAKGLAGDDEIG